MNGRAERRYGVEIAGLEHDDRRGRNARRAEKILQGRGLRIDMQAIDHNADEGDGREFVGPYGARNDHRRHCMRDRFGSDGPCERT